MRLKKVILIAVVAFLTYSCKTYERSVYLESWVDKWNYKYTVYNTQTFDRKTDSLLRVKVDTVVTNLNPLSDADVYNQMFR
jgi:hypothetical protein